MNKNETLPNWSLKELIDTSNPDAIGDTLSQYEELIKEIESWRTRLTPDVPVEDFINFIAILEKEESLSSVLEGFSEMQFEADTQNQGHLAIKDKISNILTDARNRTVFFSLWWAKLDDNNAGRLMKAVEENYWLYHERLFKRYVRSEPEEQVINLKDSTGSKALKTLYSLIVDNLEFHLEVDGEKKTMTEGELNAYRYSQDPVLRQTCYKEFLRVFGLHSDSLSYIYKSIARDWFNEHIKLRGQTSPISVRNLANDIPDSVIETLMNAVRKNAGVFQRYFVLKAKIIGMQKLRRCDIYAPLPIPNKIYSFQEAKDLIFKVFGSFSPEMEKRAKRVFDENHIDAQVRKGKHNGAFCASILPKLTAWVSLSYQGGINDVETLAHELGHAVHDDFASVHPIFQNHPCLPLAETASNFGEMLLGSQLIENETDVEIKRYLLSKKLADAYASIGRQANFAMWEIKAHKLAAESAKLDDFSDAYLANLKEQFGDSIELDDDFRKEWMTIPHFYASPFYVYAYAFGLLLVYALFKMYKTEGESFKPKMLAILSAGGSASPSDILAKVGIDIADEKFWQGGFDSISEDIDALEKLI